jgi:ribonuclease R
MPYDLFIPLKALKGARHGQKATARILEWPKNVKNPIAEIVEVLGDSGENDVEMHAILAEFDLPYRFSEEIETEADRISDTIEPAEIKSRRDFRKVPTFTIDPGDAKDYDDALSYKELGNGMAEIGIHIADVTHYVLPKTELDKEAYNRGTSVYLVDRVVPMLPEKLSNGVCSLRPREEKLCFSAVFEINKQGEIQKEWFGKTIIFSDRRFTYEEAQKVIDTGTGEMKEEILSLYGIAMKLREKRFSDGSIAFDRVEVKFNLDQDGAPLGVYFKENKTANQLIEEFMLLANKRVAELIGEKKLKDKKPRSFVFRIHDKPKSEKLDKLSRFVTRFGLQLRTVKQDISSSMNKLLQDVKGKNEQDLIEKLAIRAMAKAKYTTHNIGHYGLAFDYYTHFTSPIRRYPDMMVHRLLEGYLKEESSRNQDRLERECVHSSNMEQKAMNAEWASIKYKQVEFMMDKVGEVFDGIISGVAEWGLYVEIIENKCEGMIPIRELDDDFYEFDEDEYCLKGRSNLKCYRLGDPIKIEIYRTNIAKRQLDFRLAD